MLKEKYLRMIDEMISFFSGRGEKNYVSTLNSCKQALFPEMLNANDSVSEDDGALCKLREEVAYLKGKQSRRVEVLPPAMEGTLFVSLGPYGHSFINKALNERWWPGCEFLSIDFDSKALSCSKSSITVLLKKEKVDSKPYDEEERLLNAFKKKETELIEILKHENRKNVVLVFSAADEMSDVALEVIRLCYNLQMFVYISCLMPFQTAAKKKRHHATKIKKMLEAEAINSIFLESDTAFTLVDKRTTAPYAIGVLQDVMADRISKLFSSTRWGTLR